MTSFDIHGIRRPLDGVRPGGAVRRGMPAAGALTAAGPDLTA